MEEKHINLSYVLVTFNKLAYLKTAMMSLLAHKKKDEEIIVIDGGSKDGTPAYLKELLERGDIEQYISEPDLGLGHAINKGILRARGTLYKTLSDDDEYNWHEVAKCKAFMLIHPEIDVLGSNGIDHDGKEYRREEDFLLWKTTPYHPFMMGEQGLMCRTSSLPVFGLADTSFIFWDAEWTIRLTAGHASIAWYTGLTWKHEFNPQSLSLTRAQVWREESARLRQMYPNLYSKWKHHVPKPVRTFLRLLIPKKKIVTEEIKKESTFLS